VSGPTDYRDDLRAIVLRAMTASTGIVSRTREEILKEAIGAMEELGVCDPLPLQAAARDLLVALKAMVLNDAHTYRDCHKAALAAIAKAEGRAV